MIHRNGRFLKKQNEEMNMNEIGKFAAKLIFYLVAAVLLLWTASLTVAFVSAALP